MRFRRWLILAAIGVFGPAIWLNPCAAQAPTRLTSANLTQQRVVFEIHSDSVGEGQKFFVIVMPKQSSRKPALSARLSVFQQQSPIVICRIAEERQDASATYELTVAPEFVEEARVDLTYTEGTTSDAYWFRLKDFWTTKPATDSANRNVPRRPQDLPNALLAALLIQDDNQRLKAVLPLVHKSLLNDVGTDLAPNVKPYSYKKATQGSHLYRFPVMIERVQRGQNPTTIGFGETAERGLQVKYFIMKKAGVGGVSAPISVFLPEGGGLPKIVNMGSL